MRRSSLRGLGALLVLLVPGCSAEERGGGRPDGDAAAGGQGVDGAGGGGASGSGGSSGGRTGTGGSAAGGASAGGASAGGTSAGGTGAGDSGSGGTTEDAGPEAAAPVPGPNRMFVTSATFAPATLGGLEGADAECNTLARAANLDGSYVAWLSDSQTDAASRLGQARGWVRVDGKPFVDTVEDLTALRFYYPPFLDENGARVAGDVVTGTTPDGLRAAALGDFCGDWSTDTPTYGAVHGHTDHALSAWTSFGTSFIPGLSPCATPARLYCFQVDARDPLVPGLPPSRRVFIATSNHTGPNGVASFDAFCAAEATAGGLIGGTFKAFVGVTGASALSRFSTAGLPWGRLDGVLIAETAVAVGTAVELDAPIIHFADGTTVEDRGGGEVVYSGGTTPGAAASAAETCNSFAPASVSGGTMRKGFAGRSDAVWWNYQGPNEGALCNTYQNFYCFEE